MSLTITYIGPFTAVEIEPDPKRRPGVWEIVAQGASIECSGSVATSLLEQTDNWAPLAPLRRPPKNARKAELQAFVDSLNLDGNDAADTRDLTNDQLNELIDRWENPSTATAAPDTTEEV